MLESSVNSTCDKHETFLPIGECFLFFSVPGMRGLIASKFLFPSQMYFGNIEQQKLLLAVVVRMSEVSQIIMQVILTQINRRRSLLDTPHFIS